MPVDDAIALVIRSFGEYEAELKKAPPPPPRPRRTEFTPPNERTLYLLNLLADNRFLLVEELRTVMAYLEERTDRLIEAEGGVPPPKRKASGEWWKGSNPLGLNCYIQSHGRVMRIDQGSKFELHGLIQA